MKSEKTTQLPQLTVGGFEQHTIKKRLGVAISNNNNKCKGLERSWYIHGSLWLLAAEQCDGVNQRGKKTSVKGNWY